MVTTPGQAACGPNGDDAYCARYWEMSAERDRLRAALAEAADHVEPVDQNSELAIARWRELSGGQAAFAAQQPQPDAGSPEHDAYWAEHTPLADSAEEAAHNAYWASRLPTGQKLPEFGVIVHAEWRAVAGAVRAWDHEHAAQPAPELAAAMAELAGTRAVLAEVLAQIEDPGIIRSEAAAFEQVDQLTRELRNVRAVLAEVLSWFKPSGSGHAARAGQVAIARSYRNGGLDVPENLRKLT